MCHDILCCMKFSVRSATVVSAMAAEISKRQASQQLRRHKEHQAALNTGSHRIARCAAMLIRLPLGQLQMHMGLQATRDAR